jgi:thiosulfate reductase cytochrome b subunit
MSVESVVISLLSLLVLVGMLQIEPRVLGMIRKSSTTELHPSLGCHFIYVFRELAFCFIHITSVDILFSVILFDFISLCLI